MLAGNAAAKLLRGRVVAYREVEHCAPKDNVISHCGQGLHSVLDLSVLDPSVLDPCVDPLALHRPLHATYYRPRRNQARQLLT